MEYDVIVIGAGVGGLAAALRLSSRGKKVLLLEKLSIPGGFATTFTRKGFTFESSIHCVDSLAEGQEVRAFLDETGISKEVDFIGLTNFSRIIYPGHDFVADSNLDNFIAFLKGSFPQEKENIDKLFEAVKKFNKQFDNFSLSELPILLKLLISPFVYHLIIQTSCFTAEQFLDRYIKDDKLRAIITDIWRFAGLPPSRLSALYFLIIFKGYYCNPTAYIKGSSSRLFKAMVEKIKQSGSEVKFNTEVTDITTHNGRKIKSVITDKGEEFEAKAVISNVNALDTLASMLDDHGVKEGYRKKFSSMEKSISAFQVYLGLDLPAKQLGMDYPIFSVNTTYDQLESYNYSLVGDYQGCSLELVDHAQVDPGMAPQGKGSLLIMTLDDYAGWDNLTEEEYKKKKMEVASQLVSRAEKYLPGLSKHIEVMEAATPRTMARFGSSVKGAIYGFAQTLEQSGINRLPHETKVKGLFLAGAWTQPGGGVHACFLSGIEAGDLALRYL